MASTPEFYRGQKSKDGYAHFVWRLTFWERLRLLFTGEVVWCYKRDLPPPPLKGLVVYRSPLGGVVRYNSFNVVNVEQFDSYDEALARFRELKLQQDHYDGIAGRATVGP